MERLDEFFYHRPCLEVAHDLVGKLLVHKTSDGVLSLRITETEAYCGEADTACHAHKGRTKRNEPLYGRAGTTYVYLCYGIHWLMNVVTGEEGQPEAVLIRACESAEGPGRLTKKLNINGTLNRKDLISNPEIWIESDDNSFEVMQGKRIGIGYASPEDQDRPWRFILRKEE